MKKNIKKEKQKLFVDAKTDMCSADSHIKSAQTCSDSYKLSYADQDFLLRDELRPLRLQLELLKPEIILQEHNIHSTIVVFGSTRILSPSAAKAQYDCAAKLAASKNNDSLLQKKVQIAKRLMSKSIYYDMAKEFSAQISTGNANASKFRLVVMTGGGPGIMEAANRGANEVDSPSVGMNITLQHEQAPNSYITPELCFQFHYFALRKMHFLLRAKALAVFPGGYGTLDELFDALTLVQTHKVKPMPILLFGKEYWDKVISFEEMANEGVISEQDLSCFQFVESAQEGCDVINDFYK
jgi:uncharacterized protein (TIGR00730 family)